MATFTLNNLPAWVSKVKKVQDAVVSQSALYSVQGIEIVPGITRGGSRKRGTIPRDLGTLASSLTSTLMGSSAMTRTGLDSYTLVAGSMRAGDVARFAWGGTLAPYAKAVHYGAKGVPGTYWIDEARRDWPNHVARAVREARAELDR